MNKQSRWVLAAVAAALVLAVAPAVTADRVTTGVEPTADGKPCNLLYVDIRAEDSGRVEVLLAADGQPAFDSFVLSGPDRLVVDLPGVISRLDQLRYSIDAGGVTRLRAAQHDTEPDPKTRVVFDLDRPLSYTIEQTPKGVLVAFTPGQQ